MRHRGVWPLLLTVACGWIAVGNVPPTMEDRYVTTVQDTPVVIELRAQDEDIDPGDPEAHPLRFLLVAGPSHGVLVGEMGRVRVEGPHDAVIELTYVPASGYVGTDYVRVAVYDPYDETGSGTVTIEIEVAGRRAEWLVSGSWSVNATLIPETGQFTALATQLTEAYRAGPLTVRGVAQFRKAAEKVVFDSLRFDADVKLETASVKSRLALDPEAEERFVHWQTTIGFALGGVNLRHVFHLARPVTMSYQTLQAQASTGGVSLTNTLRLDVNEGCGFEFGRSDTAMGWRWCDLNVNATFAVTGEGFELATLSVTELPIPGLLSGLTMDAKLRLTPGGKALSTSLAWQPEKDGCVRLYGELEVENLEVEGVSIYGVVVEREMGDVKVVSATSLDPAKNSRVTGQTDYWEVLRASGTLMGCCGAPGSWGLATYFHRDSTRLFDWGMTRGRFDLAVGDHVNATFEAVWRSGELGDPALELSSGFTARW